LPEANPKHLRRFSSCNPWATEDLLCYAEQQQQLGSACQQNINIASGKRETASLQVKRESAHRKIPQDIS